VVDYLEEIVGQETAKRFVKTALKKGSLYNFLLTGPKGVGKRIFGFALAKTLGCPLSSSNFMLLGPIPAKLKEKDDKIHEYSKKYRPEFAVVKVEDRESILIEQIRNLIGRLVHMPAEGKKRVVLIIEADKMTDAAANCFLKTLEEPPLDTVFILTSSRPNYLLPTIRSRCQIVPFTYLTDKQVSSILFDTKDEFLLGSPGELMNLRENELFARVVAVFKEAPLDAATAAARAREFERKNLADFLYQLLLLYRLVLYSKLNIKVESSCEVVVTEKAKAVNLEETLKTALLLNKNINSLEQNPNRLLLLFNTLIRLP